jgi:hypothetical protein
MKPEDLRRYRAMMREIEAAVGPFHMAFGCPGMCAPRPAGRSKATLPGWEIRQAGRGGVQAPR